MRKTKNCSYALKMQKKKKNSTHHSAKSIHSLSRWEFKIIFFIRRYIIIVRRNFFYFFFIARDIDIFENNWIFMYLYEKKKQISLPVKS